MRFIFRPSHLCSSGISLYVHRPLLLLTHFSFHLAMVSSLHLFRRDSAVAIPVLPARISADSTASRSIGMTPYISNAASWDTVRNAQHTRRAHNLCTDPPSFLARAHIGAAYISVDVTTITSNLRTGCLGPECLP